MRFLQYYALVILFCVVSIASCQLIKIPVCERIDSFQVTEFDKGVIQGKCVVTLRNDNWFSFSGDSIAMEVFRDKTKIGSGNGNKEVEFAANSTVELPLNIELYADSLKADLKTMLHLDSMDVKISVSGKFSRMGVVKTTDVDARIPIKSLINSIVSQSISDKDLEVSEMRILESDLNNTKIGFNVLYTNRLPFDVTLKRIEFDIFSDAQFRDDIGTWNKEIGANLVQNDSTTIEGDVLINNMKAARSGLLKVMTGGSTAVDYYMKGLALVEVDSYEIEVPIIIHFAMDLLTREVRIIR